MAEDILKLFIVSMFAKQYSYIPEYLYFYYKNPKSITQEISYKHSLKILNDYNTVIKTLETINIDNTSSLTSFSNLKEQIIAHCKYMISTYILLNAKQSNKEGIFTHIVSCYKSLKYTKQICTRKHKILHVLKTSFIFLTFGKIKF